LHPRECVRCAREVRVFHRHVVMSCTAMRALQDMVRDLVEQELLRCAPEAVLIEEAAVWWAQEQDSGRLPGSVHNESQARWPTLSAWRWLVPVPTREEDIGRVIESSAPWTLPQGPSDLAYRGVIPRGLGKAVVSGANGRLELGNDNSSDSSGEEFATRREHQAADRETQARRRLAVKLGPGIQVTTVLLLGIRKLRAEHAERINAWRELRECSADSEFNPHIAPTLGGQTPLEVRIGDWAGSPQGGLVVARLRWAVPPVDTLASWLRSEFGPMRGSTQLAIRAATRALGIPTREGGAVCWGPRLPNWLDIKSAWQRRCRCTHPPADVTAWVCLRCGASRTPQADSDRRSICRWCSLECGRRCIACSGGLHYIGECQRWLHGADRRYAPTANERWFLCPDCWWCFAQAWASAPRRVQLIDLLACPCCGAHGHCGDP
jgi:hypothetical protein